MKPTYVWAQKLNPNTIRVKAKGKAGSFIMANVFFHIKCQMQMWKHFAIWCGKTWIKPQFHTFITNDTSTLSSFPFLWNWAKSDLVKEMCVSCSLAWRNLWHDKRQKFWCYFGSMVIQLIEFQVHWIGNIWILKHFQGKFWYIL